MRILGALLGNFGLSLSRGAHPPQLVEGVHVKGQVVEPPLEVGQRGVGKAVELYETGGVVPHLAVVSVEDVSAVAVHSNAFHLFAVDVAACMVAFVNHQTTFAGFAGFVGKDGTKKSCAYN